MSKEIQYTKKQMKSYAEHCMMKLLTTYPDGDVWKAIGEISSYDLHRIKQIINQNKEDEN